MTSLPNDRRLTRTRLVIGLGSLGALAAVVWLGVLALVVPRALGWHSIVLTSGSMAPALDAGDVMLASPYDGRGLQPGAVIVFDDPARHGRLTHRVVGINPDGTYATKGDANAVADSTPVAPAAIRGVGRIVVPRIGAPLMWAQSGNAAGTTVAAVVAFGFAGLAVWGLLPRRRRQSGVLLHSTTVRTLAAAIGAQLVVATVGLSIPGASSAAFSMPTTSGASSFGAGAWVRYYLDNTYATPPAWPYANFTSVRPTANPPIPDTDGDGSPGRTIRRSSTATPQVDNETDPVAMQWWMRPVAGAPLTLGTVRLDLWTAMKNMANATNGRMTAAIFDCTTFPTSCTRIGAAVTVASATGWGTPGAWVLKSFQFAPILTPIPVGHAVAVKVVVENGAGDDMWIAYATAATPSVLTDA